MRVLIGNIVKTEFGDYTCATREEAEALFMRLRDRDAAGHPRQAEARPTRPVRTGTRRGGRGRR